MARNASELISLLTALGRVCEARAIAAWAVADGHLQLVGDWQLEQSLFDMLRLAWENLAPELGAGQRLTIHPEVVLQPLMGCDGTLIGVMQYVGPAPSDDVRQQLFSETATAAAALLEAERPPGRKARRIVSLVPVDFDGQLNDVERRGYGDCLERCGWDVSVAAACFGMTRQALYDRMQALGLTRRPWRTRGEEKDR